MDGGTAVVFWPVEGTPGPWADDPAMLPHEIGHVLLAFVVDTGGRAAVRNLVRTAAGAAAEATEAAPPADAALGDLTGLRGDDAAIVRAWLGRR